MKREYGWLQIGLRLIIFVSSIVVLTGCTKVNLQCGPSDDKIKRGPPTGACAIHPTDGHCLPPKSGGTCTCIK